MVAAEAVYHSACMVGLNSDRITFDARIVKRERPSDVGMTESFENISDWLETYGYGYGYGYTIESLPGEAERRYKEHVFLKT